MKGKKGRKQAFNKKEVQDRRIPVERKSVQSTPKLILI